MIIGSFLLIVLGEIILNGIVKKRYKEDMEIPYNSVASKADALPTEKEMDEIVEDVFKN